jgi:hypothetical protein
MDRIAGNSRITARPGAKRRGHASPAAHAYRALILLVFCRLWYILRMFITPYQDLKALTTVKKSQLLASVGILYRWVE